MADKTVNQGPDRGSDREDMSESPRGVGTPGGAKGGAWGKADAHMVTGSQPGQPNRGKKPWAGGGSDNRGSKSVQT